MGKRKRIAVLFGGRSVEHEISIISSLQLIKAIDSTLYEVVPVYIAPQGNWYTGKQLYDRSFYLKPNFSKLTEVTVLPRPGVGGLTVLSQAACCSFKKRKSVIPIDVYIIGFHGEYGEDGCIQGLLELAGAAYTGCGVLGSSVAMNKYLCKSLAVQHGVPVLPAALINKELAQQDLNAAKQNIFAVSGIEDYPVFVKPNHLGSSIGIAKATDDKSLAAALARVFKYDFEAIVEPFLAEMFEINVSVFDGEPARASAVEIPVPDAEVLSYEDKYMRAGKKKAGGSDGGMASLTRVIDPEDLDQAIKDQVTEWALIIFKLLNCSGVSRFDFIVDKTTGKIYFNELNPIPGSFSFYLWIESQPPVLYTEVITRIIKQAEKRLATKAALERSIGFKALR